jgi:hypothetical protein
LENKKNCDNSSIPPDQAENRPKKSKPSRKIEQKVGGQSGYEGTTLRFNGTVDNVVKHSQSVYSNCGINLNDSNNAKSIV